MSQTPGGREPAPDLSPREEAIGALLVEDDPDFVRALTRLLRTMEDEPVDLQVVGTLEQATSALAVRRFDVVLLDLGLPDSDGMATLEAVLDHAPDVPVIVLTGLHPDLATVGLRRGVQDYLVKGEFDGRGLIRAVRYAIIRQSMRIAHAQELASLDQMRHGPASPRAVRSRIQAEPAVMVEITEAYEAAIDASLALRSTGGRPAASDLVREAAQSLRELDAGPRDVIDVHSETVRRKIADVAPARAQAIMEESRVVLIELLGHLVSMYRDEVAEGSDGDD